MAKHPAIFSDGDRTIIEDNGHINILSNIEFNSYSFNPLQNLHEHFLLYIITNESGISRGLISVNEDNEVNRHIAGALKTREITIFDVFYCPHKSEDICECKKPKPYFFHRDAKFYNFDLIKSVFEGSHPSDIQCEIKSI